MLVLVTVLLGLVVGSFLNVVAYRVPAGKSVIKPRSACPGCQNPIAWYDNIPLLSWLVLRAKCRHCSTSISVRYPLVELTTALLFVATVHVVGIHATLPAYLWFVAVTLVLSIIDFDTKRLPNRIVYPGFVVGLVLMAGGAAIEGELDALLRGVLGAAAYFAGFFGLAVLARGGFGFGDVKLAALLGLFVTYVSWGALAVAVFGAFVIGGVASLLLLLFRRAGRKDTLPFGPSMVVAAWIAIVWGDHIMGWYRNLSG